MHNYSRLFGLLISLGLLCCTQVEHKRSARAAVNKVAKKPIATVIVIQPFNGFPAYLTQMVSVELKKMYKGTVIVRKSIPFPKNTLNYTKVRYRADSLIRHLSRVTPKGQLTIGLTNKDISTTKGEYPDWGIMGLGYCPGKSCIASTYRLKAGNLGEKLFKVAIHELGHTQGLPHCPVKTCLMRDAQGKDHLNEEKEFCPKCKRVLVKAGWSFLD
jgi:archaemetzincin